MSVLRADDGQTLVLSVLVLASLLGMSALVIDAGAWLRESRRTQATADAAALAGAQALPEDPAGAVQLAVDYARKNGGGVDAADVTVQTTGDAHDSLDVRAHATAHSVLARIAGIGDVGVAGRATATAQRLGRVRYVAPIGVDQSNALLQCRPFPCFDQETTLTLGKVGPGGFGLVNLDQTPPEIASAPILADWLRRGFQDPLAVGSYYSATGTKYNSTEFKAALNERLGSEVLLPVYDALVGGGSTATFHVVGWVGFRISGFSGSGSTGTLQGRFVKLTWDGDPASSTQPDFGARTVELVR